MTTEGVERLVLKPEEVAQQLAMSRTEGYQLMSAWVLLGSIRIGRCRRVPVYVLRDFIEASRSP